MCRGHKQVGCEHRVTMHNPWTNIEYTYYLHLFAEYLLCYRAHEMTFVCFCASESTSRAGTARCFWIIIMRSSTAKYSSISEMLPKINRSISDDLRSFSHHSWNNLVTGDARKFTLHDVRKSLRLLLTSYSASQQSEQVSLFNKGTILCEVLI